MWKQSKTLPPLKKRLQINGANPRLENGGSRQQVISVKMYIGVLNFSKCNNDKS